MCIILEIDKPLPNLFTRLTVYVAKVFCQADNVIGGIVDKNSLHQTLTYIAGANYSELSEILEVGFVTLLYFLSCGNVGCCVLFLFA